MIPRLIDVVKRTEILVRQGEQELLANGFVRDGDRVVLVFGAPIAEVIEQTNSIRLHQIMTRADDVAGTD